LTAENSGEPFFAVPGRKFNVPSLHDSYRQIWVLSLKERREGAIFKEGHPIYGAPAGRVETEIASSRNGKLGKEARLIRSVRQAGWERKIGISPPA
jgi:hypothetical protein